MRAFRLHWIPFSTIVCQTLKYHLILSIYTYLIPALSQSIGHDDPESSVGSQISGIVVIALTAVVNFL